MLASPLVLAAFAGVVVASAEPLVSLTGRVLAARQFSSLPSACTSLCTTTENIYNACLSGDDATCLGVCTTDTWNSVVGCFSCVLENQDVTSTSYSSVEASLLELEEACASVSETPSSTSSLIPFSSLTATATGAATASVSDTTLSFSSVELGSTLSATGASVVVGSGTTRVASGTSAAATAAASSAIAASSSSGAAASAKSSSSAASSSTSSAGASASSALPLSGGAIANAPPVWGLGAAFAAVAAAAAAGVAAVF